jgi:hypothetical protein
MQQKNIFLTFGWLLQGEICMVIGFLEERLETSEARKILQGLKGGERFFSSYWGSVGKMASVTKRPYGQAEAEFCSLNYDAIQRGRAHAGSVQKNSMFLPKEFYTVLVDTLCTLSPYLKGMCMEREPTFNLIQDVYGHPDT